MENNGSNPSDELKSGSYHTSKWTKISSLESIIFELKNDGKKWSRIYFEIHLAPSEIPAKLLGLFGHSGLIFCTGQQQL